ncbi:WD40-repeat-containing domain protein [Cokeromyces recurvatus]|uniref:WD40-repeat-containing domain protein n=1 Tax=Cokeromyces recurvatus TaxID=90255 RepID=UPI00221EF858|nr:WD40-repeat-containing domain protein [Cokeromyces recurvatus]KAI7905063.1 WD40-repeat-containing domain protein [Cokeromyces recurvatus]
MKNFSCECNQQDNNRLFPTELLLCIFSYLDGITLNSCKQVCRHWLRVILHYDDVIWPNVCHRDFEKFNTRRFWSLQFPIPSSNKGICNKNQRSWQDMYRITKNWYNGYAKGFYPSVVTNSSSSINNKLVSCCTVIGTPQEQGMFTNLTVSPHAQIIRSNPNYHHPMTGSQSLIIQSPRTKERFFFEATTTTSIPNNWTEAINVHSIVCHYTHPSSKWLATGGLDGTVAIWDLSTKSLVRIWHGHRGRTLCISMNNDVVVSGGSDNVICVWDLDKCNDDNCTEWTTHHRPTRRGMINISSYLSGRNDWYQGVGEIEVNDHLIACAPDASGPILIFSLLTGSLVYELQEETLQQQQDSEWITEDISAFTRPCLTPFFLLAKGKVANNKINAVKLVPSDQNIVLQRNHHSNNQRKSAMGYIAKLDDNKIKEIPAVAHMTPYQLYQYYKSINTVEEDNHHHLIMTIPQTSACINVWDLQTGKIAYKLLPTLENPYQNYTITDIRLTPDFSKVFASIEVRAQNHYEERLYCWDFDLKNSTDYHQDFDIVELDNVDSNLRKTGKSWVCFM